MSTGDDAAQVAIGHAEAAQPGLRWTIGDVSERGFEALRLSLWGAWKIFGGDAEYAVCVNTVGVNEARERTGPAPQPVQWIEVKPELPAFLVDALGRDMADGMAWKLWPLQLFADRHEIALDNDCILWALPPSMRAWLAADAARQPCLMAEDVLRCYGQFGTLAPRDPFNAGIRGLPPRFDLAAALRGAIARGERAIGSALHLSADDEQGLQATALSAAQPLHAVSLREVTVCSPFWPHRSWLGECGAHFVGLNARHIPWDYYQRTADECMTEHWQRHREALYRLTGAPGTAAAPCEKPRA